ncbi:MAG TPA: hypothetical protein VJR03_08330 [Nitrospira sp.]|nr:hypothetical protein [Nitrospira sp.]
MRPRLAAAALLILVVANSEAVSAQDTEERRSKLELGAGAWITTGETKWAHNASSIPGLGNPTSKLTYNDVGTNVAELTAKLWVTPKWFGRLTGGYATIGGGRLTDDDYLAVDGGAPSSRTFSDIKGDSTLYLNADVGRRIVDFPHSRGWLEAFIGYQYYYQKYTAYGLGQVICSTAGQTVDLDPSSPGTQPLCNPNSSLSSSVPVITNTTRWHSIRLGGTLEYRLTRRFSVQSTIALIPVSVLDNKDVHHQRPDLDQNPSLSMLGYGVGADADIGARFMIIRNLFASLGYRVYWNRMVHGNVTFHDASGLTDEFPLTQFQTLRYGLTFGLNYAF